MTTIKQPFQCNLPPQLQETHRTTHTGTTTRCKTRRRNNSRQKRPPPHPSHTRGTFHSRLQPLYTEKHKVSCSGFLPLQCVSQPTAARNAYRTTHTGTTTLCKTHRRNNSRQKRPQPHTRRTHEVPFIAGCSHFTRKNTRFCAPVFFLKT